MDTDVGNISVYKNLNRVTKAKPPVKILKMRFIFLAKLADFNWIFFAKLAYIANKAKAPRADPTTNIRIFFCVKCSHPAMSKDVVTAQ